MRVVVLLKQIADPEIIEFDVTNNALYSFYWIFNPIDLYGLEESLRIKERYGGEVTAISISPDRGDDILKKALIWGADKSIRFWDDRLEDTDTWVLSGVIKKILKQVGFDLVICGLRSADTGTELMGAALSERLSVSLATRVVKIVIQDIGKVQVDRNLEKGNRETRSLTLPAVITVEKGINDPRYVAPFSENYTKGFKKEIEVIHLDLESSDLNPLVTFSHIVQARPRTKVGVKISSLSMEDRLKLMRGELGGKKDIFRGPLQEGAKRIMEKLREWGPY